MFSGHNRPKYRQTCRLATVIICGMSLAITSATFGTAHGDTGSNVSQDKAIAAADALVAGKTLASGQSLQRVSVQPGDRDHLLHYINYDLKVAGLRVVGGEAVVVADEHGSVRDVRRQEIQQLPTSVKASVSADAAKKIATKDITVSSASTPELVVLATQVPTPTLAYEVVVEGTLQRDGKQYPTYQHVFVDASNEKVLARAEQSSALVEDQGYYSGKVGLEKSGAKYESTMVKDWTCIDQNKTVLSGPANGEAMDLPTACVDVQYAVEVQTRMYKKWFNRDGLDGRGGTDGSEVGLQDANAYWTGRKAVFGHNKKKTKQITNLDSVGHEYGHGLLHDSGRGLFFETGIQEGAADIMGTAVQYFANNPKNPSDYVMGENMDYFGDGKPDRYQYQPSLDKRSPDCYDGKQVEQHLAAGPLNHWFYLLAEGSDPTNGNPKSTTCNGSKLPTGVGLETAVKVWYNATLRRSGDTTSWALMRSLTLASSKDLGQGCDLYNKTKAAWDAVDVKAGANDPTCDGSTTKPTTGTPQPTKPTTSPAPTTSKPTSSKPMTSKPVTKPASSKPVMSKPATSKPGTKPTRPTWSPSWTFGPRLERDREVSKIRSIPVID